MAIKTFRDRQTEAVFNGKFAKAFGPDVSKNALRKLSYLHAAKQLDQLRIPPANQLEALKRNRLGQYSIRVNDHFRICFRWHEGDAYDVELVDYH